MSHKAMGASSPMCDLVVVRCSIIFCALRHSWRARCTNIFAQSIRTLSTAEGGGVEFFLAVWGHFSNPYFILRILNSGGSNAPFAIHHKRDENSAPRSTGAKGRRWLIVHHRCG